MTQITLQSTVLPIVVFYERVVRVTIVVFVSADSMIDIDIVMVVVMDESVASSVVANSKSISIMYFVET